MHCVSTGFVKLTLVAALLLLTLAVCGGDKKPKGGGTTGDITADTSEEPCIADCDDAVIPDDDGYMTDPRDGKRYRTVKIGDLTWMAENINHEANGSTCYDENESNCAKYGRLYSSWYMTGICPAGWRQPSVADWDNLFAAAGGSFDADKQAWNTAGTKLKSKTGWKNGGNGTDDFGFSALPGGFRENYGQGENVFIFAGAGGYWWANDGNYVAMGWDMSHVNENRLSSCWLSVRCVTGYADPAKGRPAPPAPEINTAVQVGRPDVRWYKRGNTNFTISTADQLAGLAQLAGGGNNFAGVTFLLSADIDLSAYGKGSAFNDGKGWIPIGGNYAEGSSSQPFQGSFDGNGKKIRGLYINDPELDYAGLFGYISDGVIKNVSVADVNITGKNKVGGVVGYQSSSGQITGCYSTGAVSGADEVGGVAGYTSNHLSNSYSTATVNGSHNVGGVVGHIFREVNGCYSTGTVRGTTNVGGVAGYIYAGKLENCYSTGAVSGRAGRVGGVVGLIQNAHVTNCYSTSPVSGREGTGGVAGSILLGSSLSNSAALNPSVKGIDESTGRIAGYIHNSENDQLFNNAAFTGIKDKDGKADRWNVKGEDAGDGTDITAAEINADGAIGSRFSDISENDWPTGWTNEDGKLPGLGGKAVEMPEHLK